MDGDVLSAVVICSNDRGWEGEAVEKSFEDRTSGEAVGTLVGTLVGEKADGNIGGLALLDMAASWTL